MDSRLLAYAERQAPRYTSYPPAPHFSPAVDARVFSRWLSELPEEGPLSLYLHVPYCRELCRYCGCNTHAARRDEPVADFVGALLREIDLVAEATPARQLGEIHWGGGTPNILSPAQFERIAHHLAFWFDLDSLERHAVEIDPRSLTPQFAQAMARARVNRASLGVQDLNEHVQRAIGRVQPFERVKQAVIDLRLAGVGGLSFDLMYGLPRQTVEDCRFSVRRASELGPQRIALFGYAHVPWFKKRQRLIAEADLPGAAERFDQAEAAREELVAVGYVAVGFDHYARPDDEMARAAKSGTLRRNFQGYVAGEALPIVGLGPSAISSLPQGYAQNNADPGLWRKSIAAERFAVTRGHAFTGEDRRRGALIETLLCSFKADLASFGGMTADEQAALAPLTKDGLAVLEGGRLTIPEPARPFARLVAQVFDAYARGSAARHSRAV